MKYKEKRKKVKNKINQNKSKFKKVKPNRIKDFKEECKKLIDPREPKMITYKIWDIVTVVFLASLADCDDWEEIRQFAILKYEWLRSFLQLTGGIPCTKTYKNVISLIDSKQLEQLMIYFINNVHKEFSLDRNIYSLDGKVDNASGRKETKDTEEIKKLNVLNVYSKNDKMCIFSRKIDDKSNEIPAVKEVLELLNVKGGIVTFDALNTQKDNITKIIDRGADYVAPLKGNHGIFYDEIKLYFDEDKLNILRVGHGGVYKVKYESRGTEAIKYEYFQTEDISWFEDKGEWTNLKSIGLVIKTVTKDEVIKTKAKNGTKIKIVEEKTYIEKRYYISSLLCDIESFSEAIREHWQVESKLHWQLDFTFKCDKNRTLDNNALLNLQIIKKGALAFLTRVKPHYGTSLKLIRKRLASNFEDEASIIFKISE